MATLERKGKGHCIKFFIDGKRIPLFLGAKYSKKTANELKGIIETLVACRDNSLVTLDKRTQAWIESAAPEIREKLESVGLIKQAKIQTLGQLWDEYLADRQYIPQTLRTWNTGQKRFFAFYKESDSIESLTRVSIMQYKKFLEKKYAEATVANSIAKVHAICNWAVERDLFVKSPALGIKGGSYRNKDNDRFVEMVDYQKMLDVCRTQEQRAILTLARIGGLRTPSEIANLTWKDINWDEKDGKIWIQSPKTERHVGKDGRFVPLWEPVRKELQALYFADEPDGKDDRVFRNRNATSNLRTRFKQIQIRAGLIPIPRFFDNCRASRSNEVFKKYGAFLESQWIGHTQGVAMRHYYQVQDIDYQAALEEVFESKPSNLSQSEIWDTFLGVKTDPPCIAMQPAQKSGAESGAALTGKERN